MALNAKKSYTTSKIMQELEVYNTMCMSTAHVLWMGSLPFITDITIISKSKLYPLEKDSTHMGGI